ncbi:hypothetical protein EZV62_004386 [Acer yangbiense]|uniref:AAA+ ATPase domain-containing protein n=1 Tax=Acer yangbiense TaxID=1000413 RepID=A0A5C7IJT3_9ROSI|nr:hypothetical protein EZV62_004386 [Acer yangbiense]
MAEIGISVAAKTAEYTVDPIARQFGYMWDYKSNFQNLEKQVQMLKNRRDTVQHSIDDATKNGEEIEKHVANWLDNVKKMIDEAAEIITDNNQANMRCFKRLCPDLKKRYQHSKKAAVKAKDVSELEKEGKFDRISYRTNPKETWHPSSKLYEDFESRRSTVDGILNELCHPGVNMVGVHGMGGIGKTTLAREVGKQAEEQKLFDAVVFVEISDKPDTIKIQEAIADKLGLEFRERSESGRARTLCERLKKESKLLLILDNIWKGLELDKVGIPFGNDHPGCKLLLTARSIDVLPNVMSSKKNFPIDGLNEKEAWDLFNKVAGACIEQDNLQSLAFDVAKRCGGLPIAIVTIAKALKDKPVHAWRNALRELKRPSSENLVGSVTAQTYSCIWLSYNQLETDELKSTFLLCSTMGFASDASVEELLRYGMGLRLFKTVYKMEEARDRVNTLVQKLKESSLLLDHTTNGWFSIHDVVRDVGRAIASKDENKITVIDDVIPWKLKDQNIMKNCTSLSLYDITELPNEEFDCPTLEFLYMESNSNSSKIPDDFFRGMPNLRVLHLMEMELSPLPTSLGCLVNLRTLCLNCNLLSDMGFIEDMKDLEILVLSCDTIEQLPKEVGKLTQLRVLDLSSCFGLEIITPNTISRLTKLEELYMPYGFNQWQVEGVDSGRSNVSLEELKDMSQLTTLQICIQDAKIVPKGLFSQKLQRYEIHIGANPSYQWNYSGWDKTSRFLALDFDDSIYVENIVVKQLKGIEELYLIGKQGVENVLYELNRDDFPQLKHFDVQGNSDLVYIVDSSKQSQPCEAFPRLETFSLRNVISLEKICHGELMPNSFCRLRNIKVEHCDKLKNFFSFSIASHLSQLQEIEVTDCENMEEFFTMGRRNDVIVLDQLQFLCLKNLPKLRRFCSEAEVASSSDQEKQMLDTPMPFFDGKVEFTNLKSLELRKMNVNKIWHNQLSSMSSSFQNLTDLVISHCCNLKYIFTSSTLRSFVQLQCLVVGNCKVFEEVIRIDDGGNNVELLSLKKLSIVGCPEMKTFIFNDKVEVPNLKTLELRKMNVDKMWHNQLSSMSSCFQNLTDLIISDCCNLKYLFASSTLTSFVQLQRLEIRNCKVLEEIIRIDDLKYNVELLSLKKLSIEGCPEMKAFVFGDKDFCSGNIHNFNFPSLEMFFVFHCFKMNIFSSAVASTPMLRKMEIDFIIYDCEGDVNTTIQRHIHENEVCY